MKFFLFSNFDFSFDKTISRGLFLCLLPVWSCHWRLHRQTKNEPAKLLDLYMLTKRKSRSKVYFCCYAIRAICAGLVCFSGI